MLFFVKIFAHIKKKQYLCAIILRIYTYPKHYCYAN